MNLHAWMTAWETQMAEAGFPKARISIHAPSEWEIEAHDLCKNCARKMLAYSWNSDIDANYSDDDDRHSEVSDGWDAAHRIFVEVDHLRPEAVLPSLMLAEMLAEQ